jgi:hypothetical protein
MAATAGIFGTGAVIVQANGSLFGHLPIAVRVVGVLLRL